ncbi:hypothetical protein GCK32_001619 [Trichostrongylus colubriformis]|uniref:Uncharacterized protein n=1 Tax=Trichostrongylus colubriformis TaxID=6319 RepID=A0AAN8FMI2_TRICO
MALCTVTAAELHDHITAKVTEGRQQIDDVGFSLQSSNTCTIKYDVTTENNVEAHEFCDLQHPYTLKSFKHGRKTECVIIAEMECGAEVLIGNRCFSYGAEDVYSEGERICKSVSKDHVFHKVSSTFEQKWIATFFSRLGLLWVQNTKSDVKDLSTARLGEGMILTNDQGRAAPGNSDKYVVVLRKGSLAHLKPGVLAPMLTNRKLTVLCSRPAKPRQEYFTSVANRMKEVGYKITMAKDLDQFERPFTVIRGLHSFEIKSDFDAGTQRLHKSCEAFESGYAATPYDFHNPEDFKKVLKEAAVNIVAVPGRRRPSVKTQNLQDCRKDPNFKEARKQFIFDVKRNDKIIEKNALNDSFWAKSFPDRTCADMPRVALAFTQNGLVDVPNIARLFVVCTFGGAPSVKADDGSDACSPLADFNAATKTCKCRTGFDDIRDTKLFATTAHDKSLAPGTVCINCNKKKEMDVFFIMDASNKDTGFYGWSIVKCLRITLAYYGAQVRLLLLGGDDGIRHDTGKFAPAEWNVKLKDEWFGLKQDEYMSELKGLKLKPGLERAFKELDGRVSARKLLIMLLDDEPGDIKEALESLNKLITGTESRIDRFVASRLGHKKENLKKLSTTGEVYKIGDDFKSACIIGTKVTDLMLRLHCTL